MTDRRLVKFLGEARSLRQTSAVDEISRGPNPYANVDDADLYEPTDDVEPELTADELAQLQADLSRPDFQRNVHSNTVGGDASQRVWRQQRDRHNHIAAQILEKTRRGQTGSNVLGAGAFDAFPADHQWTICVIKEVRQLRIFLEPLLFASDPPHFTWPDFDHYVQTCGATYVRTEAIIVSKPRNVPHRDPHGHCQAKAASELIDWIYQLSITVAPKTNDGEATVQNIFVHCITYPVDAVEHCVLNYYLSRL